VSVNGEEQPVTTSNSFDLTAVVSSINAYSVKVKAVSESPFIDSNYSEEVIVLNEPANVLASFNSNLYEGSITKLNDSSPITKAEYIEANANDGFGGHDGALQITINTANYYFVPMFGVTLAHELDLTTYSKVKIRMRVVSLPRDLAKVGVFVADTNKTDFNSVVGKAVDGSANVGGDWTEIVFDINGNSANMVDLYGDTNTLGIGIGDCFSSYGNTSKIYGEVVIQIDYIEYVQ
jgi:hypothetical protein